MTTILLVEDDEMNRDMLGRRLRRKGFDVLEAGDGQTAIDCTTKDSPDFGYGLIHYKGAPIVPSADVGDAYLYGLNSHYMVYAEHSKVSMKTTSVDPGPSVDARVRKIQHMCQFFIRSLRQQAVMSGWS